MKVLVTGHNGYIGSVMVRMLGTAGHEVVGLDTRFFDGCTLGADEVSIPEIRKDIRDATAADLASFDAVIHLAALCNDPLGDLDPELTFEINHRASVRLAEAAKAAGVKRYLFASSCSLYGVAGTGMLAEDASFNPITPYGLSKVMVEESVAALADADFSPTFLRNATAYGVSPRLRADVVVNNLVGYAYTTGEVVIKSDGTPWRPLVHVEDLCRAFVAVLHAPRERVHNEAFNVGRTEENYTVRELVEIVMDVIPGCKASFAEGAGPDPRSYRVDCGKIQEMLPEYRPEWTVRRGVEELVAAFDKHGLTREEFFGPRYLRIKRIQQLLDEGRLDQQLRWTGRGHDSTARTDDLTMAIAR